METLKTKRLYLKQGTLDDFKKVYEYNFSKLRNILNEVVYEKNNVKELEKWFDNDIDKYYKELQEKKEFDWIIYLINTDEPIGNIVADRKEDYKCEKGIELTINIHPTYWGKGYAQKSIEKVIEYLYSIGFDSIIYGYDEGNDKSKRVCEKLNFEMYKVIPNDWIKNGIPITSYKTIKRK